MDGTTKYINLISGGTGNPQYMEVLYTNVDHVTIDHNWQRVPVVTVLDENLSQVVCSVVHASLNSFTVYFKQGENQTGKVIIN